MGEGICTAMEFSGDQEFVCGAFLPCPWHHDPLPPPSSEDGRDG